MIRVLQGLSLPAQPYRGWQRDCGSCGSKMRQRRDDHDALSCACGASWWATSFCREKAKKSGEIVWVDEA